MRPLVLLREMELPVVVEVAARAERPQAQDRFGADERPACTRAPHPILDEVTTRTLDHAGRDRQPISESTIVVKPPRVLDEVIGALHDRLRCGGVELLSHDHAAEALGNLAAGTA